MAETYSIKTVRDFLRVPDDRREVCLQEFLVWIRMGDLMGGLPIRWPETFDWIDDDLHTIDVRLKLPDETISIVKGRMKGFDE